jgi:hypothetical protein
MPWGELSWDEPLLDSGLCNSPEGIARTERLRKRILTCGEIIHRLKGGPKEQLEVRSSCRADEARIGISREAPIRSNEGRPDRWSPTEEMFGGERMSDGDSAIGTPQNFTEARRASYLVERTISSSDGVLEVRSGELFSYNR